MKKQLILVAFLLSQLVLSAQPYIDSLWTAWESESVPDSSRLKALDDIVYDVYMYSQPDSAFYWSKVLYDFADKVGNKKYMAIALNNQGQSYQLQSKYQKALVLFRSSYELQKEISNQQGMASALNNMGIVHMQQGNYPKALGYFEKSLKLFEGISNTSGMANTLGNIGIIYFDQHDLINALDYHQRSLQLYEEIGNVYGIGSSSINAGLVFMEQKSYDEALEYFLQAEKQFEEISNTYGAAYTLKNIANIYKLTGDYDNAILVYQESLDLYTTVNDRNGIASAHNDLGIVYNKIDEYSQAIDWCEKGLNLALEIGAVQENKDACECLFYAYEKTGNYSKALFFHKNMQTLGDSIQLVETAKKLQQMEFTKQLLTDSIVTAEKDRLVQESHEQEVRSEKQTRNSLAGIGCFLLLLAGGIYSRLRFVRKSKAALQIEKDRSENLLLNILPAEIAAELKEKGKADARDFDLVSILFTDFKGFTQASAKLSAHELVAEINICFEEFDGIMAKYNIEKIKTIGDAYMAAGGLPVPSEDSVKNTVLAALEMQSFISHRKVNQDAAGEPAFEMRVGIHTGPVVAGIVGVKKFQYDIWGDTVNTASRMESSGDVGQVNISEATYDLLKDASIPLSTQNQFIFESRGKIAAKGKGELEMYFVKKSEQT